MNNRPLRQGKVKQLHLKTTLLRRKRTALGTRIIAMLPIRTDDIISNFVIVRLWFC